MVFTQRMRVRPWGACVRSWNRLTNLLVPPVSIEVEELQTKKGLGRPIPCVMAVSSSASRASRY